MKYIIDIDALKDCLDLLPTSYSDIGYVDLIDVKKLIDRFPKEEYGNEYAKMLEKLASLNEDIACNTQDKMGQFETCENCGHYGWNMPQCKECNAANGFKYFSRT